MKGNKLRRVGKRIIQKSLALCGFKLARLSASRCEGSPVERKYPWEEDEDFQDIWKYARRMTLLNQAEAYVLHKLTKHCIPLGGNVAEVGVYRGGTAMLIGSLCTGSSILHLFDTFEGMPETDPVKDWHRKGDFKETSLEAVREYLCRFSNIAYHKGLFPSTADSVMGDRFSFVHVDVDIYQSVADCCDFFYPRMLSGGIIVFDDYGRVTCPGAKLAVDEFFNEKSETPCFLGDGQCFVVKH